MAMESPPFTLDTLRSKIAELSNFLTNSTHKSVLSSQDSDKQLRDWVFYFENKVNQIVTEHSDIAHLSDNDLDVYLDRLRAELTATEAESASISEEIESLGKSNLEATCQLESKLESLRHVLDCSQAEVLDPAREVAQNKNVIHAQHDDSFEILKLRHQIEMNKITLKSLQDLDLDKKRVEAMEKIQEALTGLKVIDFEGNTIRVSLKTYIQDVEGLMSQLEAEDCSMPSEVNHELLIEVLDENMELKNVEIFPNDVYLGEIVEAANTFSKSFMRLPVLEIRNTLGWFLEKVQDKIALCTLRRLMVKIANKTRHSFEYSDKDESIIAQISGGIDAFLKPSEGWPLPDSTLKLVSLRSSNQNSKEFSSTLLSKVEETANSLELKIRRSLTDFVDGIEEIVFHKIHSELQ